MFTTSAINSTGSVFPTFPVRESARSAPIRPRPRPAFAVLAFALLAAALAPLGSAHANINPHRELSHEQATPFSALFGSREIRSTNLAAFSKWTRVLDRHAGSGREANKSCTPAGLGRCIGGKNWKRFLSALKNKDKRVQIEAVNRYVNQATYIPDRLNYGTLDYWATPSELFARGGDCEDFAIAKFFALRSLGFDNKNLRLVVLQDLQKDIAHAVLVVNFGRQDLILDNQLTSATPADQIRHYKPIYSINENHWWLHRTGGSAS